MVERNSTVYNCIDILIEFRTVSKVSNVLTLWYIERASPPGIVTIAICIAWASDGINAAFLIRAPLLNIFKKKTSPDFLTNRPLLGRRESAAPIITLIHHRHHHHIDVDISFTLSTLSSSFNDQGPNNRTALTNITKAQCDVIITDYAAGVSGKQYFIRTYGGPGAKHPVERHCQCV